MRLAIVLGLAAGLAAGPVLAGCDGGGRPAAPSTGTVTWTGAPTPAPSPTEAATPSRTPPATVDAPCPYADAATVMDIVGQHIARITVTRTTPHPGCAFYRPNGEKAADVAVSVLANPAAAQAEAIRLTGPTANPVDSVGDGGTVAITGDGATLAVSSGAALVVVRINQRVSLEAIELAKLVVATL